MLFSSVAQLFLTLCDPMDCSRTGLPVHRQLPEFTQTHVHWVWCHPTISSSVIPFSSCLQSFPASPSFQMSQLFASSIGVSASTSVFPMNIQDWFPLGGTDWIFSNTTVHIDPMIQYVLILCIKYITNENLLYNTGNSTQSSLMT